MGLNRKKKKLEGGKSVGVRARRIKKRKISDSRDGVHLLGAEKRNLQYRKGKTKRKEGEKSWFILYGENLEAWEREPKGQNRLQIP